MSKVPYKRLLAQRDGRMSQPVIFSGAFVNVLPSSENMNPCFLKDSRVAASSFLSVDEFPEKANHDIPTAARRSTIFFFSFGGSASRTRGGLPGARLITKFFWRFGQAASSPIHSSSHSILLWQWGHLILICAIVYIPFLFGWYPHLLLIIQGFLRIKHSTYQSNLNLFELLCWQHTPGTVKKQVAIYIFYCFLSGYRERCEGQLQSVFLTEFSTFAIVDNRF